MKAAFDVYTNCSQRSKSAAKEFSEAIERQEEQELRDARSSLATVIGRKERELAKLANAKEKEPAKSAASKSAGTAGFVNCGSLSDGGRGTCGVQERKIKRQPDYTDGAGRKHELWDLELTNDCPKATILYKVSIDGKITDGSIARNQTKYVPCEQAGLLEACGHGSCCPRGDIHLVECKFAP
jgi:hypothetical protein